MRFGKIISKTLFQKTYILSRNMNTRMYRNLNTLLNHLTNQCLDKYGNNSTMVYGI